MGKRIESLKISIKETFTIDVVVWFIMSLIFGWLGLSFGGRYLPKGYTFYSLNIPGEVIGVLCAGVVLIVFCLILIRRSSEVKR